MVVTIDEQELKQKFDKMVWSFSRISSYEECPYMFSLKYLSKEPHENIPNAFAQWGTMMHGLIEDNVIGLLSIDDMYNEYKKRFRKIVTEPFPYTYQGKYIGDAYYNDGIKYIFNYGGVPDTHEVVGTEIEVRTTIDGHKFCGYTDLLLANKETHDLILIDHKSKAGFRTSKEQAKYARQLYLYCKYVNEHYGSYPKYVVFNMFRLDEPIVIPFSMNDYEEALSWAKNTIDAIYANELFSSKLELNALRKGKDKKYDRPDFFCENICDQRYCCEARNLAYYA